MIRPYNDELAGDMVGFGFKKKLKKIKKKVKKVTKKIPKPVKIALNPLSAAKYIPIKNKALKTAVRLAAGDVTAIKPKKIFKAVKKPLSTVASIATMAIAPGGAGEESEEIEQPEEMVQDVEQTADVYPAEMTPDAEQSEEMNPTEEVTFSDVPSAPVQNAQPAYDFVVDDDAIESGDEEIETLSGEMVGSFFKSLKKGTKKVAKTTKKVATSKAGIAALSAAGGAGAAVVAMKVAQSGGVSNFVKSTFGGKNTSTTSAGNAKTTKAATPKKVSTAAMKSPLIAPRVSAMPAAMMSSEDATPGNTEQASAFGGIDLKKMVIPILAGITGLFFLLKGRN